MKTYRDFLKPAPKKDLRESYIQGDLFKVGDIVEADGKPAEIINLGTNYVTLVAEGQTFKKWINEVTRLDELSKAKLVQYMNKVSAETQKHDMDPTKRSAEKRNKSISGFSKAFDRVYAGGALTFKGYTTKHFQKEHIEFFAPIMEHKDQFAVLNCLQSFDNLLGMNEHFDFGTANKSYSRAVKYFRKFALDESILSEFKETIFEHAVTENKIFIADGIAESCSAILKNIYTIDQTKSADVLQEAVNILGRKQGYRLSEGWETLGAFARIMKANGVNTDGIHTKTKTLMGI